MAYTDLKPKHYVPLAAAAVLAGTTCLLSLDFPNRAGQTGLAHRPSPNTPKHPNTAGTHQSDLEIALRQAVHRGPAFEVNHTIEALLIKSRGNRRASGDAITKLSDIDTATLGDLLLQHRQSINGIQALRALLSLDPPPAPDTIDQNDFISAASTDCYRFLNSQATREKIAALFKVKNLDCSEISSTFLACCLMRASELKGENSLHSFRLVVGAYFVPEDPARVVFHQWVETQAGPGGTTRIFDPAVTKDGSVLSIPAPAPGYVSLIEQNFWLSRNNGQVSLFPSSKELIHYLPR